MEKGFPGKIITTSRSTMRLAANHALPAFPILPKERRGAIGAKENLLGLFASQMFLSVVR